jgi:hypothetical protein
MAPKTTTKSNKQQTTTVEKVVSKQQVITAGKKVVSKQQAITAGKKVVSKQQVITAGKKVVSKQQTKTVEKVVSKQQVITAGKKVISKQQTKTVSVMYYGRKFNIHHDANILPTRGNIFETVLFQFKGTFDDVINNVPLLNPSYPLFQKHYDMLVQFDYLKYKYI